MKTLSDFKRRIKIGQIWSVTNHVMHGMVDVKRPISVIQSNAIAFKTDRGTDSCINFPKASDCKFPSDNQIQIFENGELILTYTFISEE